MDLQVLGGARARVREVGGLHGDHALAEAVAPKNKESKDVSGLCGACGKEIKEGALNQDKGNLASLPRNLQIHPDAFARCKRIKEGSALS